MFVGPNLGVYENNPAKSGYDILQNNKSVSSGSYWIKHPLCLLLRKCM